MDQLISSEFNDEQVQNCWLVHPEQDEDEDEDEDDAADAAADDDDDDDGHSGQPLDQEMPEMRHLGPLWPEPDPRPKRRQSKLDKAKETAPNGSMPRNAQENGQL